MSDLRQKQTSKLFRRVFHLFLHLLPNMECWGKYFCLPDMYDSTELRNFFLRRQVPYAKQFYLIPHVKSQSRLNLKFEKSEILRQEPVTMNFCARLQTIWMNRLIWLGFSSFHWLYQFERGEMKLTYIWCVSFAGLYIYDVLLIADQTACTLFYFFQSYHYSKFFNLYFNIWSNEERN